MKAPLHTKHSYRKPSTVRLPNGETVKIEDIVEDYIYFFRNNPEGVADAYNLDPIKFEEYIKNSEIIWNLVQNTLKNLSNDDIVSYRAAKCLESGIEVLSDIFMDSHASDSDRINAVKVLYAITNRKTSDDKNTGAMFKLSLNLPDSLQSKEPITINGGK